MQEQDIQPGTKISAESMQQEAAQAEATIFVSMLKVNGADAFSAKAMVRTGASPLVQSFIAAVHEERQLLLEAATGKLTDADRYRALRDFALLHSTDNARFEKINEQLQAYEEEHNVDLAKGTTADEYDEYSNLLATLLATTDPEQIAAATHEAPAVPQ